MKFVTLLLATLCMSQSNAFSFQQPNNIPNSVDVTTESKNDNSNGMIASRREAFRIATTAAASAAILASSAPTAHAAGGGDATAFIGTFSDPINHPGGTRTIRLLEGQKVGDYQLAEVQGGGGVGEPKNYVLPAVVVGDRTIIIDFSPKGGPRDFAGVLDGKSGDIKFLRDGNRWPRIG